MLQSGFLYLQRAGRRQGVWVGTDGGLGEHACRQPCMRLSHPSGYSCLGTMARDIGETRVSLLSLAASQTKLEIP